MEHSAPKNRKLTISRLTTNEHNILEGTPYEMDNYFNMNPDPIKDTDSKSEICIEEGSDVDDIQSSERKKTGGRETLEMILGNFLNPS